MIAVLTPPAAGTETTTMAKYTAGPWTVEGEDRDAIVVLPAGWTIVETPHIHSAEPDKWDTEHMANMALIANAPDLAESMVVLMLAGWTVKKVSLYDEDGIEGWQWTEPDGTDHNAVGPWDEIPPWPDSARESLAAFRRRRAAGPS